MNTKTLTVLLVVCCLISGYVNVIWWNQRAELHASQEGATAELAVEKRLYEDLRAITDPVWVKDVETQAVEKELVGLVMSAKSDLPRQMITLTGFNVSRPTANSKGAPLASLFVPIPRTAGFKSTPVKLTGKYRNLRLLQAYVRGLQKHPVVVSSLRLENDNFALTLQLIGK